MIFPQWFNKNVIGFIWQSWQPSETLFPPLLPFRSSAGGLSPVKAGYGYSRLTSDRSRLAPTGSADVFNPANGLIDFWGKRLLRVLGFSHGSLLLSLVSCALCVVPNEPVRLVVTLERAPFEDRGRL